MEPKYLKWKNKIFLKIFKKFLKQKKYESIYYYQGGSGELNETSYIDYWDLLGLIFEDEQGYTRSLIIPVPLLPRKYRDLVKDMAWLGVIGHCDRSWHDVMPRPEKPDGYYPSYFYEKIKTDQEGE